MNNISSTLRVIILSMIFHCTAIALKAQNTYSGAYTIKSSYTRPHSYSSDINGIATYSYVELNDLRVLHGPFRFSTSGYHSFLPTLLTNSVDTIIISGTFNQGYKNGEWKISGANDDNSNHFFIEMTFSNGVLDGPVKGYSSGYNDQCSFSFTFLDGKLSGQYKVSYNNSSPPSSGECLLNFSQGLYHGTSTISFFDSDNKEFKVVKEYDNGLLINDKFQDESTGEYIINKNYNYDISLADFSYADFHHKRGMSISGSMPPQTVYPEFFALLADINESSQSEVPYIGYVFTSNSEIFMDEEYDTITRVVIPFNRYFNSYSSNKREFLKRNSDTDELWHDKYRDEYDRTRFVNVELGGNGSSIIEVSKNIFELLNVVKIFSKGQEKIAIKPIKLPYVIFSDIMEQNYYSYRSNFLQKIRLDSITKFEQDSVQFYAQITDQINKCNIDIKQLDNEYKIFYYKDSLNDAPDIDELSEYLSERFESLNAINRVLTSDDYKVYVDSYLLYLNDSTVNYYHDILGRLDVLDDILLARQSAAYWETYIAKGHWSHGYRFQTQIKKLHKIPGAEERYNVDRQFRLILDETTTEELYDVLRTIYERNELYTFLNQNYYRINPLKKYNDIDEFLYETNVVYYIDSLIEQKK